jgi:hypothetical protein
LAAHELRADYNTDPGFTEFMVLDRDDFLPDDENAEG